MTIHKRLVYDADTSVETNRLRSKAKSAFDQHQSDAVALEVLNPKAMTNSATGARDRPGKNVSAKCGLNRVMRNATFEANLTMIKSEA